MAGQFTKTGPVNKTEARAWLSRILKDVRAAQYQLRLYSDDSWKESVRNLMEDAGGSAATLQTRLLDEEGA